MDDYRKLQRERWLQQQEQAAQSAESITSASESSPAVGGPESSAAATTSQSNVATEAGQQAVVAPSSAAASSSTPASPEVAASSSSLPIVRRIHILPFGIVPPEQNGTHSLEILAGTLRRLRAEERPIKTGQFLRVSEPERTFIIVKCEPELGLLSTETDYFVDGDPVQRFTKVQFICLWDFESGASQDPSSLFSEYISPYFKSLSESGEDMAQTVSVGDTIDIFGMNFQVLAAEPSPPEIGVVDTETMVFVDWDTTPEFDKIHIVPFQDTLPNAYNYDVFNDYLKPYLTKHKHNRFAGNDTFTYQGVQFKVVCCEPVGPARIGRNTTIYCEGVLHPSLRNLMPPELLEQLSHLPPGLQMLLLNTEALSGDYEERLIEVQEMLSQRRGMSGDTINQVEKMTWTAEPRDDGQTTCMVCLAEFTAGEEVRKLPCNHVFHCECIDEWLRRCTDCPICKANVDRALRNY